MAKLNEFLAALAKKSGLKMDDEKIAAFLGNEALAAIEVPDEVTALDNKLITIADAKNNHPEIKPHYTSQSLAPLDKIIEALITESGLDKDAAAEIIANGSSYQRVPALVKAIQAAEGKKGITDKEARAAFQKQTDEAMAKVRALEAEKEAAKTEYEKKLVDFKLTHEKRQLFNEYKTIHDDLPANVKATTFSALLENELQEKGAKIVYDENGNLALLKNDGTNYYGENNQQVNVKQFTEGVLSKNKLLKVTNPGNNNNSTPGQRVGNPLNGGGPANGENGYSSAAIVKSLNAEALADYNKSATQ